MQICVGYKEPQHGTPPEGVYLFAIFFGRVFPRPALLSPGLSSSPFPRPPTANLSLPGAARQAPAKQSGGGSGGGEDEPQHRQSTTTAGSTGDRRQGSDDAACSSVKSCVGTMSSLKELQSRVERETGTKRHKGASENAGGGERNHHHHQLMWVGLLASSYRRERKVPEGLRRC